MKDQLAFSQPSSHWQPPKPLMSAINQADFPVDSLPMAVKDAVTEVQMCVKSPLALVAGSALGAMSVAIQAHYDVQRAQGLSGPVGIFCLQVAESGERKTSSDKYFIRPIEEWQTKECLKTGKKYQSYESRRASLNARRDGLLDAIKSCPETGKDYKALEQQLQQIDSGEPIKPRMPRMLLVDETPESLVNRLCEWPSVAISSSEAGLVFGGHAMNPDVIIRNLAQLNVLWDGHALSIGRKSSANREVTNARLTMSLQIQPSLLRDFFRKSGSAARGSGFLSRFLMSYPASTQGTRFFEEPPEHLPGLEVFHARVMELLSQKPQFSPDGGLAPRTLQFSPEAKTHWVEYHDFVENELRSNGDFAGIRDVASKSAENAARIAAIFHAFSEPHGDDIESHTMQSACEVARWYLYEANRILHTFQPSKKLQDAMQLDEWLQLQCKRFKDTKVAVTRLQQAGPNRMKRKQVYEPLLSMLEGLHRVRRCKHGRKLCIEVNPQLLDQP